MRAFLSSLLFLCAASSLEAQTPIGHAMNAWTGGPGGRTITVVKDGVRCGYSQTARDGYTVGHLIVGFWAPGCNPSGASFELPISRVRLSLEGNQCVFECTGGTACLKSWPQGQLAARASMYEAIPGTCMAFRSALAGLAAEAEAALRAKEIKDAERVEAERQRVAKEHRAQEERVERKRTALSDCGSAPGISGGPWFSSTYKIAAFDEARRAVGRFLCVKQVEYISAAPNPFGGNAARARFTGYDNSEYMALVEVRDFPY